MDYPQTPPTNTKLLQLQRPPTNRNSQLVITMDDGQNNNAKR